MLSLVVSSRPVDISPVRTSPGGNRPRLGHPPSSPLRNTSPRLFSTSAPAGLLDDDGDRLCLPPLVVVAAPVVAAMSGATASCDRRRGAARVRRRVPKTLTTSNSVDTGLSEIKAKEATKLSRGRAMDRSLEIPPRGLCGGLRGARRQARIEVRPLSCACCLLAPAPCLEPRQLA